MVTSPFELRRERRVSTAASIDPSLRRSVAASTTSLTADVSGMQLTGDRWLTEDTRDFIAVFTRAT